MDKLESTTAAWLCDESLDAAEKPRRLLAPFYDELRAVACERLRNERRDHMLRATGLVHEAYLKLVGPPEVPWTSRAFLRRRRHAPNPARPRPLKKRGSFG